MNKSSREMQHDDYPNIRGCGLMALLALVVIIVLVILL